MYEQFMQLGNNFMDAALAVPPSVYGLIIGSTGLAVLTFFVNKIIKIYTEITSSKVFAGIFLLIGLILNFADYIVTNGQFHLVGYGKTSTLLIGGATFIYHGAKIVRAIASQVAYYAPLVGQKAQAVKAAAATDTPAAVELPSLPVNSARTNLGLDDQSKNLGAF